MRIQCSWATAPFDKPYGNKQANHILKDHYDLSTVTVVMGEENKKNLSLLQGAYSLCHSADYEKVK